MWSNFIVWRTAFWHIFETAMIDILQHILFWPILIAFLFGVMLLGTFPRAISRERWFFIGCLIAMFLACILRQALGVPARRYYMVLLPLALPLAVILFMVRAQSLPFFRNRRKCWQALQLAALFAIILCCVGKACRKERVPVKVLEITDFLRSTPAILPGETVALMDNTTEGGRAFFATRASARTVWIWEYYYPDKEEVNLHVIRTFLAGERSLPTETCYILFQTSTPQQLHQLIQLFVEKGDCSIAKHRVFRYKETYVAMYMLEKCKSAARTGPVSSSQPAKKKESLRK